MRRLVVCGAILGLSNLFAQPPCFFGVDALSRNSFLETYEKALKLASEMGVEARIFEDMLHTGNYLNPAAADSLVMQLKLTLERLLAHSPSFSDSRDETRKILEAHLKGRMGKTIIRDKIRQESKSKYVADALLDIDSTQGVSHNSRSFDPSGRSFHVVVPEDSARSTQWVYWDSVSKRVFTLDFPYPQRGNEWIFFQDAVLLSSDLHGIFGFAGGTRKIRIRDTYEGLVIPSKRHPVVYTLSRASGWWRHPRLVLRMTNLINGHTSDIVLSVPRKEPGLGKKDPLCVEVDAQLSPSERFMTIREYQEQRVRVFDIHTGAQVRSFSERSGHALHHAQSNIASWLSKDQLKLNQVPMHGENQNFSIWDMDRKKLIVEGLGQTILASSHDGRWLVTTGIRGLQLPNAVHIIDIQGKVPTQTIDPSTNFHFQFSPSGRYLMAHLFEASGIGVEVWDLRTGTKLGTLPIPNFSKGVRTRLLFSQNESHFATYHSKEDLPGFWEIFETSTATHAGNFVPRGRLLDVSPNQIWFASLANDPSTGRELIEMLHRDTIFREAE